MVSSWNINNTNIYKELIDSLKIEKKNINQMRVCTSIRTRKWIYIVHKCFKKAPVKNQYLWEKKKSKLNLFEYIENGNLVS